MIGVNVLNRKVEKTKATAKVKVERLTTNDNMKTTCEHAYVSGR